MGATITWERIEDGVYRRPAKNGRPIYKAYRQGGRREDGTQKQETATFNGSKLPNALKAARLWRARGEVQRDAGALPVAAASSMTLQEAYERLHADPENKYAP